MTQNLSRERATGLLSATGSDRTTTIVGDGYLAISLARRLSTEGTPVQYVGPPGGPSPGGVETHETDVTDSATLAAVTTPTVVVAMSTDARNLLVAQLLRTRTDATRVVVVLCDDTNRDAFSTAGIETVCACSTVGDALVSRLD